MDQSDIVALKKDDDIHYVIVWQNQTFFQQSPEIFFAI